jgi:hypothetical protein
MINVTLEKVVSTNDSLRTDSIDGQASGLPVVGERFNMTADGLYFGIRYVSTSPVVDVFDETGVGPLRFRTANSTYELTVHDALP